MLHALINAVVQLLAIGIKRNSKNTKAFEGIPALFPLIGHRLSRYQADLDCTNDFWDVVCVNTHCSSLIQPLEDSVQMFGALLLRAHTQFFPKAFRS